MTACDKAATNLHDFEARFSCLSRLLCFENTCRAIISSCSWPSVRVFWRSVGSITPALLGALSLEERCFGTMARSPGSRWPVITAGSGGTMKVGMGFFGFLTLGGRPREARRLARMRFLYCFQRKPRRATAQMASTPALETMAETIGVLARWLKYTGVSL